MSFMKKIRANLQIMKGRIMRRSGDATGNRQVANEGRTDQVVGNLKLIGEKVKDVFKR